jgi:hypothetical protein
MNAPEALGASAPNKANLPQRQAWTSAGKAIGATTFGTHRVKQSQFAASVRKGKYRAKKEL